MVRFYPVAACQQNDHRLYGKYRAFLRGATVYKTGILQPDSDYVKLDKLILCFKASCPTSASNEIRVFFTLLGRIGNPCLETSKEHQPRSELSPPQQFSRNKRKYGLGK